MGKAGKERKRRKLLAVRAASSSMSVATAGFWRRAHLYITLSILYTCLLRRSSKTLTAGRTRMVTAEAAVTTTQPPCAACLWQKQPQQPRCSLRWRPSPRPSGGRNSRPCARRCIRLDRVREPPWCSGLACARSRSCRWCLMRCETVVGQTRWVPFRKCGSASRYRRLVPRSVPSPSYSLYSH